MNSPTPTKGPGTQLRRLLARWGAPHCADCDRLAAAMDAWGPDLCRVRIDLIVGDITPRAMHWASEGWITSQVPEPIMRRAVRRIVLRAIARSGEA